MTLPPILLPSFWFNPAPPPLTPWIGRSLLVVFVIFFFVGIVARLVSMKKGWEKMARRALRLFSTALVVLGLFGLLLSLLDYERTYVLGMRAGYLLWFVVFVVYAWRLYKYWKIQVPAMQQQQSERERLQKWLPKSKK